LRGESRFSVTVARSRQSSRLRGDRQHPYRAQTRTTQATENPICRQRCLRVTRSPELQSANSFAARIPFRLPHSCDASKAVPPLLPNPKAKRSCSSLLQLRPWIAQMGRYQRGGRSRAFPKISKDRFFEPQSHTSRRPRSRFSAFPNVRLAAQSVHSAGRLATLALCSETNKTERSYEDSETKKLARQNDHGSCTGSDQG